MAKNVVTRIRPQLTRKRAVVRVPHTKVLIQPSKTKTASLQQLKSVRAEPAKPAKAKKAEVKPPTDAVVSKRRGRKSLRRKTQVKYITANVSPESLAKIKAIKGAGAGKILVIVGNGPSISQIDLRKIRAMAGVDIMSINRPDDRVWPTEHWCFFDGSQMKRHEGLWTTYQGNIFNSTAIKKQKSNSMQVKNLQGRGFSRDLTKGLHIGRSSVFAAMQIAFWLDYAHVYIVGCDMNPDGLDGKLHFYGVNPDVNPDIRRKRFKDEAAHYAHAATVLSAEERAKYTFCTKGINPWPFMQEFNSLKHTEAIDKISEHAAEI